MCMRRTLIMIVLAAMCARGAVAHAQTPALSNADTSAITALSESFSKALAAKDWKAVSALFTAEGALYAPGETAVKGRPNIEACLAGLPPMAAFSLSNHRVEGHDDIAYVQGTFAMTLPSPPGAAAPPQATGYFLEVLRRQSNGKWLIAVQMFTTH
jgi:uncharacterized protein (TIGR02246 family)